MCPIIIVLRPMIRRIITTLDHAPFMIMIRSHLVNRFTVTIRHCIL